MRDKRVAIYGSTGSIGTQTLDVIGKHGGIDVVALACRGSNLDTFERQIREHKPRIAALIDERKADLLRGRVADTDTKIVSGVWEAMRACASKDIDTVVNAAVGIAGLEPSIHFILHGKELALANKETIVTGGSIVMELARRMGVRIVPIDSEHSAIMQCLEGNDEGAVENIWITASGGPFRGQTRAMLRGATKDAALNHPSWKMGQRITIDSATLMNKGFEVIEARWLFDINPGRIKVLVHPGSKVHGMVEFKDRNVLALISEPDMREPIQYALYHSRMSNGLAPMDFAKQPLIFEKPDERTFGCLNLAYRALEMGGTATAVLNGADERAVDLFLKSRIGFLDIERLIRSALKEHEQSVKQNPSLSQIVEADRWARAFVENSVWRKSVRQKQRI